MIQCLRHPEAAARLPRGLVLLALLALPLAQADDGDAVKPPFKLTAGQYFYLDPAGNYDGRDLNLRYRREDTSAWIGYYRDRQFGEQARIGFDSAWQPWVAVPLAILPSLQAATRGFVGGSLALQAGNTWFAQAGIGRTNLQPYANLDFDPNDALSFAVGHHADDGSSYTLSTTADDRLHTGQRHSHLVGQWPLPGHQRLTVDILRKTGDGDSGHVAAWGATLSYDFPRWFLRAAYDPKQNFSNTDATRISLGARF